MGKEKPFGGGKKRSRNRRMIVEWGLGRPVPWARGCDGRRCAVKEKGSTPVQYKTRGWAALFGQSGDTAPQLAWAALPCNAKPAGYCVKTSLGNLNEAVLQYYGTSYHCNCTPPPLIWPSTWVPCCLA